MVNKSVGQKFRHVVQSLEDGDSRLNGHDFRSRDHHVLNWHIPVSGQAFDLSHDFHAFDDFAEDDVFAIEPWRGNSCDEELTSITVGSAVCHRQESGLLVRDVEAFVVEPVAID